MKKSICSDPPKTKPTQGVTYFEAEPPLLLKMIPFNTV